MDKKRNVAFIGLGTMGYPMAGHLSKLGLVNLRIYNRTMEKAVKWGKE
ncbi:MAG: NAD(P)-binding domain-containing protein, partial [Gammaproteobacteria bacterium]|nr:NAD(P)-binding domain-containing protein [Gammaproteobacteria bacterium]